MRAQDYMRLLHNPAVSAEQMQRHSSCNSAHCSHLLPPARKHRPDLRHSFARMRAAQDRGAPAAGACAAAAAGRRSDMHTFIYFLYELLTASLNLVPAVNAGRAEAAISSGSPVLGFLPVRAAVSVRLNVPKPAAPRRAGSGPAETAQCH